MEEKGLQIDLEEFDAKIIMIEDARTHLPDPLPVGREGGC